MKICTLPLLSESKFHQHFCQFLFAVKIQTLAEITEKLHVKSWWNCFKFFAVSLYTCFVGLLWILNFRSLVNPQWLEWFWRPPPNWVKSKALRYNFSFVNTLSKWLWNVTKVIELNLRKIITSCTRFCKFLNQIIKFFHKFIKFWILNLNLFISDSVWFT